MIVSPPVPPSDDAEAQRDLNATLERFRGDARVALGLRATDDAAAARKAFMALCKVYHPAKFARFSPQTVKLSNEVFLSIRRAYESLSTAPAPASGRAPTVPGVGVPAERPSGSIPRIVKFTPPTGVPVTPSPPTTPPPVAARPPERPSGTTIPRPATPRPSTPTPGRAQTAPPPPPRPADPQLAKALDLAEKQQWAEARAAFVDVAARHPGDPRYRAYVHYARGWEAFTLGKDGEARAEWQRASALDPGNALAKWALESTGMTK